MVEGALEEGWKDGMDFLDAQGGLDGEGGEDGGSDQSMGGKGEEISGNARAT